MIVVHLRGLDCCTDRGLPTDGAMLVFWHLTRAALEKERNIVVTTDHSGEAAVPFFANIIVGSVTIPSVMEEKGSAPSDVDLHLRVRGGVEDVVGRRLLAFLVDGENAPAKLIAEMLAEASKYGTVIIRRVYGDWSSPQMRQWREVLGNHALVPFQQFPNVSGKNAIDIALIVDAMDMLHGGIVKGFCLVSSDSDYTRLATRIREEGHFVMGIGDEKTPAGLRRACDVFVVTGNLEPAEPPKTARKGEAPRPKVPERSPPLDALPILEKAFGNVVGDDGLALMADLGANLRQLDPGFDPRTYGKSKLVDLIDALPEHFEIEHREALGPGAVYVRRKRQ